MTGSVDEFAARRAAVKRAAVRLEKAIAAACPGPHRYVQHRDGKPAWCPVCGRTRDGFDHDEIERAPVITVTGRSGR